MIEYGLVLSGGSLTAISAHCGVLSAIDLSGQKPVVIVANSGGAIAGGLYASGVSPVYVITLIAHLKKKDIVCLSLSKFFKYGTIISNKKLKRILEANMRFRDFNSLPVKFATIAVNLTRGKKEVIKAGCDVIDAMLASAAIPFLFEPVRIGLDYFVDGGGVSNTPIGDAIKTFPEVKTWVVASLFDFDPRDNVFPEKQVFKGNIFTRAFNVFQQYLKAGARELATYQAEEMNQKKVITIDLRSVKRIGLWDFEKVRIPFQQTQDIAVKTLRDNL